MSFLPAVGPVDFMEFANSMPDLDWFSGCVDFVEKYNTPVLVFVVLISVAMWVYMFIDMHMEEKGRNEKKSEASEIDI
ncbi:MAG: hypothetical protein LBP36_00640 [Oscillospiraceae bacterium]|jgi:hypothetical protein|nr:hypothetical protein [Oscillospiraceae bacterium]